MIHEVQPIPSFPGFPDLRANVTFVPIQFFTIVVPNSSRGTVRIVGYALRKILGWVDEHGNPTQEQLRFTYRELIEKAGVSRESIAEALREAVDRRFLRCLQTPQPDRCGQPAQSGLYELCWDHEGCYTDRLAEFRGFYFPEAVVMEEHDGARLVARPKAARKNISNVFFDYLLPRERLSVIRVVGALLFYSIQWGPGGERKVSVSRSITDLSRLTRLSRQHAHEAVSEAQRRGYIEQVDAGCFDTAAGKESRAATYRIRWAPAVPAGRVLHSESEATTREPVRKSQRALAGRSEKVDGAPVRKDERTQSEKVNEERSGMVNGIRIKTDPKTDQTTATATETLSTEPVADAASSCDLLLKAGFDEVTARRLARKCAHEIVQRQLEWLPHRTATRNRLGFLRRAIEQDWPKPEGAEGGEGVHQSRAKVFASHYYAAYHDFAGEAATEPFPKDITTSAKFLARLLALNRGQDNVPEWGRRFGRLVRDRHRANPKASPNLSFALVLFGDSFLRLLESEGTARRRETTDKAREAHQAAFRGAYLAYLRTAELELQQAQASVYEAFTQHRQRLRRLMSSGPFLTSGERLARFESEESRLLDFADFFQKHPQQIVLEFWAWDAQLNPRRFGSQSTRATPREIHA